MTPSSSFCLLPKEVLWPFRFPWYRTQVTKALEKKKSEGATVEVVLPACHERSSRLCLLFGPFGPTSLQEKAAAYESQRWDSHQLAGSKMALSRDYVVQKR